MEIDRLERRSPRVKSNGEIESRRVSQKTGLNSQQGANLAKGIQKHER